MLRIDHTVSIASQLQHASTALLLYCCTAPVLYCCTAGGASTPVEVRRAGLRSMRRMLPRMQLAGRASAVLHPLIRVLDGPAEELRQEVNLGALSAVLSLLSALLHPPNLHAWQAHGEAAMCSEPHLLGQFGIRICSAAAATDDVQSAYSCASAWVANINVRFASSNLAMQPPIARV